MPTDINISQLIINKLTKEQYNEAQAAGNISESELYFITDNAATPAEDVVAAHNESTEAHADIREAIPTKVSQLDNDSSFATVSVVDEKTLALKNELLNGAGEAYDTLKELGDLIDENTNALDALETVATGKQDKISGTFGQIVGFDANGNAIAQDNIRLIYEQQAAKPLFGQFETESWASVVYGNGMFVATTNGDDGLYGNSNDGVTWTNNYWVGRGNWSAVAYGADKFVLLQSGTSNVRYGSAQGSLSTATLPVSADWSAITYGDGKFVAIANGTNVAVYSEDGINWTSTTLPASAPWSSIAYGNGLFIAVAYNSSQIAYSQDGINWTQKELTTCLFRSITYGNSGFIAVNLDDDNSAGHTIDGIDWYFSTLPFSGDWRSVTYGNGKYVAVAKNSSVAAYLESGGTRWTAVNLPASENWNSITYGNGIFVVIAENGSVACSNDGINWYPNLSVLMQNDVNITEPISSALGVNSKQDKLSGTTGQMVGFDANGNAIAQDIPTSLPAWTEADEGKFLRIVNGAPAWVAISNAEEVAF